MVESQREGYRKTRNFLIWSGLICGGVAQVPPLIFSIFLSIIGISLVICGCWNWAKYKGRNGWWAVWGFLAPIGFIVLSNMKDEYAGSREEERENIFQKTPQKQEADRLERICKRVE